MKFKTTDVLQSMSEGANHEFITGLALLHVSRIQNETTRSRLEHLTARGDYVGLCSEVLDYDNLTISDAIEARQVLALYQKRADICLPNVRREEVARRAFMESEERCLATNRRLRAFAAGGKVCRPDIAGVLHTASQTIAAVLGNLPDVRDLRLSFGPGATTTVTKKSACPSSKFSDGLYCSEGLVPILPDLLEEVPHWVALHATQEGDLFYSVPVTIVPGKLDFVPKNAKTDRSIVVEPVLNSFIQLGIGDYIARRLRRFGIDIRDQTANQKAARTGSLDGSLATLDLSAASDTIATELVYNLLPIDWALALDACRTKHVSDGESILQLQKFCTMGNGFTFPLETLIFWSLAKAASGGTNDVLAYGDDIIVPTSSASLVIDTLEFCGFVINRDKSYVTGRFRESCGADYLSGINIRPCYVKDRVTILDLFRLHNFYVRGLDKIAAEFVLKEIPRDAMLWGPDGYGDGHLVSDQLFLKAHRRQDGYGGFTFDTYSAVGRRLKTALPGDRVLPVYSIYARDATFDWRNIQSSAFTPHTHSGDDGTPVKTLPGVRKYKRISIYTFAG